MIEVKTVRVENRDIDKDFATLRIFKGLGYQRVIYLIYGRDASSVSEYT